jgi:diphthine synthase
MALYIIGIGLSDANDITLKGLETVKKCSRIFLESYTSVMQCPVAELEKVYGKNITLANRTLVESKAEEIIIPAKDSDVAFLVMGDPLVATTHIDLFLRAKKEGVEIKIIHNASIVSAIGATGLQVYKFGKTASIPFSQGNYMPETPYNILQENQKNSAHTLLLLDLKPEENKFMTIADAISYLLKIEERSKKSVFTESTLCIGCARIGSSSQKISVGTAKELLKVDFGAPVHALIVPGKLHFLEEEALKEMAKK